MGAPVSLSLSPSLSLTALALLCVASLPAVPAAAAASASSTSSVSSSASLSSAAARPQHQPPSYADALAAESEAALQPHDEYDPNLAAAVRMEDEWQVERAAKQASELDAQVLEDAKELNEAAAHELASAGQAEPPGAGEHSAAAQVDAPHSRRRAQRSSSRLAPRRTRAPGVPGRRSSFPPSAPSSTLDSLLLAALPTEPDADDLPYTHRIAQGRNRRTPEQVRGGYMVEYHEMLARGAFGSVENDGAMPETEHEKDAVGESDELVLRDEYKHHNHADDCWINIQGHVFDVTKREEDKLHKWHLVGSTSELQHMCGNVDDQCGPHDPDKKCSKPRSVKREYLHWVAEDHSARVGTLERDRPEPDEVKKKENEEKENEEKENDANLLALLGPDTHTDTDTDTDSSTGAAARRRARKPGRGRGRGGAADEQARVDAMVEHWHEVSDADWWHAQAAHEQRVAQQQAWQRESAGRRYASRQHVAAPAAGEVWTEARTADSYRAALAAASASSHIDEQGAGSEFTDSLLAVDASLFASLDSTDATAAAVTRAVARSRASSPSSSTASPSLWSEHIRVALSPALLGAIFGAMSGLIIFLSVALWACRRSKARRDALAALVRGAEEQQKRDDDTTRRREDRQRERERERERETQGDEHAQQGSSGAAGAAGVASASVDTKENVDVSSATPHPASSHNSPSHHASEAIRHVLGQADMQQHGHALRQPRFSMHV